MGFNTILRTCTLAACALALLASSGCKSVDGQSPSQATASDLSGPPVFNNSFQAREPRKCAKVTKAPSVAQAIALVQCFNEKLNPHEDWLYQNVQVEMASPRAFIYQQDSFRSEIDTAAKVYPIRGSYVGYVCGVVGDGIHLKGQNCMKAVVAEATGICWKTTFGDWNCDEGGVINPTTWNEPPPPPTY